MKKLFTVDDLMVAAIAALGYGYGETIAKLSGWPPLVCSGASVVLGFLTEKIINRIVFSEAVQKKPMNRIFTFAGCILFFLAAHIFSSVWMGMSMLRYLGEHIAWTVGLPVLGFFVNLLIRAYRIKKVRGRYGDGNRGYVFHLEKEDIEETNRQNRLAAGETDDDLTARTRTGIYVGEREKKTISYRGIPYAKPPVGPLRWKAPEPLPASEAVYEAKHFGASAVQVEHTGSIIRYHRQSEDCLTLNICVGAKKTEAGKPVLVLFHDGDFTCGGAVNPLLYGVEFVNGHPDIVFVSFNYRLGIFGFIDFTEVPGGEACPDALNLGLLDQIAALKWIRENIAAFGGDPDRITVLGFDSGATSILLLAASEQARGLFRKAFVFNGSPVCAYDTPEASGTLAKKLLKETRTGTMEELLQLKTEALKEAAQKLWKYQCAPTCDGTLIPADVYQAFRNGAASSVEFIVGFSGYAARQLQPLVGAQKYKALIAAAAADIRESLKDSAGSGKREYADALTALSGGREAKTKIIEQGLALCVYHSADRLAAGGSPVRLMYWGEKPLIEKLGSGSVDAAAALLGNRSALEMYGSVMNADLSEVLRQFLHKYVNGTAPELYPNEIRGVDAIQWRPFPQALVVSGGEIQCGPAEELILSANPPQTGDGS